MRQATALPTELLSLRDCNSISDNAAVMSGDAAGVSSDSPGLGCAVGVAADAAATGGVKWYGRSRQQAEHDAIAAVAGPLQVGGRGARHVAHIILIGDEHGTLRVVRSIANLIVRCKDIVFSVESGAGAAMRQSMVSC